MTVGQLVADYAFDRPDLDALKSAGVVGVVRYLAPLPNEKVIDAAELETIRSRGLALALVWETTADRAAQGYAAGQADATRANWMADALGFPIACPIFYAVDFDGIWAVVADYFAGAASVGKRPVGAYGSAHICQAAEVADIPYRWQTVAWSNGVLVESAHLYQRNYHTIKVPGAWDENVVLQDDWGQWPAATAPTPPAQTQQEEAEMWLISAPPERGGGTYQTDGARIRGVPNAAWLTVFYDVNPNLGHRAMEHAGTVPAEVFDSMLNWDGTQRNPGVVPVTG